MAVACVDEVQSLQPDLDRVGIAAIEQAQGRGELFGDGRREEEAVRVLGHVRDAGLLVARDRAALRGKQTGERAEQGRLARAVASEERDDLALRELEVDAVQHRVAVDRDPSPRARSTVGPGAGGPCAGQWCQQEGRFAGGTARASRTVSGSGSQPSRRPRWVTGGAPS